MTTSLDKQAREFWRIWADDSSPVPQCLNQEIEFAAAFATQVREQTVEKCAKALEGTFMPMQDCANVSAGLRRTGLILADAIRLLAAPPETTEQEER